MITKLNTSVGGEKKGGNALLWIGLLAIGGFVVYQYVIKPRQANNEENQ
jgi:hypothetical protein